ncbi:MAG TPA: adenosylmethionine--8-amino-7-oxononanoate transaminase [Candidatus Limnocylindria bacterium]|jgi:adenosylmethionine-8-amino-7-oxononanoate aminotransferase|nr:adenosylmethionine--8-amino-7-oxononanoate transaminase [Candidatus Limnocylindria bacterium]
MHPLAQLDHAHVWHPFTQMRDWLRREPIMLTSGQGAVLRDVHGREYLDANSSIWTNLHGHNHPRINAALGRQLKKVAHTSALGFANEPASRLAEKLVQAANPPGTLGPRLARVFFSDDGSTAMEVALKLAYEFARRTKGQKSPRFLGLQGAYHGDTVGAVSLGHIDLFHKAYAGLLFKTDAVMAPYCYRCPFNRARPERADARDYRECHWECVGKVEAKFATAKKRQKPYAGFVFEPRMQGAAGLIPQPAGWLSKVTEIARDQGAALIADEVMTGFGRTDAGTADAGKSRGANLFACPAEGVQPDFLALAKGLTGGYLPMAATLTTPAVFEAFLGEYAEFRTFFHGHSFTGNQLGAAAALASLDLLSAPKSIDARHGLGIALGQELKALWALPQVGDIRQVGLVAGVELVRNWQSREPFDLREQAGIRVCEAMARRGVLTRPIGSVIVLMPPYCTTRVQLRKMVAALAESVAEVFGPASGVSA